MMVDQTSAQTLKGQGFTAWAEFACLSVLCLSAIVPKVPAAELSGNQARSDSTPTENPLAVAPGKMPSKSSALRDRAFAGPMAGCDEIIFAQRVSGNDHWYGNFGHYSDGHAGHYAPPSTPGSLDYFKYAFGDGGRLCRFNLRTRELAVLLDDPEGGIRDPFVHYNARKILFSYRKGGTTTYHLYEIGADGTNLRQLTDGPDNDIEPIYAPDGSIIFCSSRCHRYVPCWKTQVATLYRCNADGAGIRMLSNNAEQENTPWMLPDGRVLYMRWEYVDRNQLLYHHLWSINPDGTGVMVYFGNQYPGYVMIDAKPNPPTRGKSWRRFHRGTALQSIWVMSRSSIRVAARTTWTWPAA